MVEAFSGTESITTTEQSMTTDTAGPDNETSDGEFRIHLDLNGFAADTVILVRMYEKCRSGDTQREFWRTTLSAADGPAWQSPRTFSCMHGWDGTLVKVSGTDATVLWSIREVSHQTIVSALTLGAIADAVLDEVYEGTQTFRQWLRLARARLWGKATVPSGDGSYAYRDQADTKNRIAGTVTATARAVSTEDGT
jgi:hypothetical protein